MVTNAYYTEAHLPYNMSRGWYLRVCRHVREAFCQNGFWVCPKVALDAWRVDLSSELAFELAEAESLDTRY